MKEYLTLLIIFFSFYLFGQTIDTVITRKKIANNTFYGEIGGVCGWGGLHYERLIYNTKSLKWKFSAGLGYSQYHLDNTFYKNKALQATISYGDGKNNIYYDFSLVYFKTYYGYKGIRSFLEGYDWFVLPKIGIRYQKPKNGLYLNANIFYLPNLDREYSNLLHLGYSYISQLDQPYIPSFWFGIGIGYTFKCL